MTGDLNIKRKRARARKVRAGKSLEANLEANPEAVVKLLDQIVPGAQ